MHNSKQPSGSFGLAGVLLFFLLAASPSVINAQYDSYGKKCDSGKSHTVTAGETCASIATAYATDTPALQSLNSWISCSDLWVGTALCLPGGTSNPGNTPSGSSSSATTTASDPRATTVVVVSSASGTAPDANANNNTATASASLSAGVYVNNNTLLTVSNHPSTTSAMASKNSSSTSSRTVTRTATAAVSGASPVMSLSAFLRMEGGLALLAMTTLIGMIVLVI